MPRYKVLVTDYAWPDLDLERRTLAEADAELVVASAADPQTLAREAADVDAIMTNWVRVGAEVLEKAQRCRMVARLGIGLDNIDLECAKRRNMIVTNVPDYCMIEVAEHTLAMVLALGRKIAFYHHETKLGRYDLAAGAPLRRMQGQTLGLVGLGNIGRLVAQKAQGLGLKVVGYSRSASAKNAPAGVEILPLEKLLAESDYVSLHAPLTAETRKIIGREALARMKPSAYLINTSRGGLVDHPALAEALAAGQLAGAALDVHDPEPPPLDVAPWNDPRVLVVPHAAFVSAESLINLRQRTARQVADFLSGRTPENIVG